MSIYVDGLLKNSSETYVRRAMFRSTATSPIDRLPVFRARELAMIEE